LKLERAKNGGGYSNDHDNEGGNEASTGERATGQDEGGECIVHAVFAVVACNEAISTSLLIPANNK
jgi:hypothetical protein